MRGGAAACFLVIGVTAMSSSSRADTIQLYAAGSLRAALTEIAKSFEAESGNSVQAKYGASGLLKDEIAGGASADVFASANMEHPRALSAAKKSGPVLLFARNRLCALVKPGLKVDGAGLLDRMLDPAIKLAIDTEGRPFRRLCLRSLCQGGIDAARCASQVGNKGAATHRQCHEHPATRPPQRLWLARCRRPR